jgi:hypothetical protein
MTFSLCFTIVVVTISTILGSAVVGYAIAFFVRAVLRCTVVSYVHVRDGIIIYRAYLRWKAQQQNTSRI